MIYKDKLGEDSEVKTIQLYLKGRVVTSQNGVTLDFGDAYPVATEEGKITITKKFIQSFLSN